MIGGVLPRVSSLDFPLNQLLGAQSCWSFASPEPSSSAVTPNSSEIWPICCLGSDIPRAMSNCLACLAKHNLRCYRCTNGPYFRADLPILPIWPMANFELTVTMWLTFGVPTVRNLPQVNTAFKPPMGFHWSRMSLGSCDQKPKMPCCVEKLYENSTQKCKKINQTSIIIQPLFIFLLDAVDAVESYSVWPIAPKSWYCPLPSRPKKTQNNHLSCGDHETHFIAVIAPHFWGEQIERNLMKSHEIWVSQWVPQPIPPALWLHLEMETQWEISGTVTPPCEDKRGTACSPNESGLVWWGKYMEMLTFWAILILRSSSSSSLKTSSAHFEPHAGWVVDWWCWHSRDSVTACRKNIHPASSYWTLKCAYALALKMGQPQIQQAESCWIIT